MKVVIKKLHSEKTGKDFLGICFETELRNIYVFPKQQTDFVEILNLMPKDIANLPKDYELVIGEIKRWVY